jgi:hypothetical protein
MVVFILFRILLLGFTPLISTAEACTRATAANIQGKFDSFMILIKKIGRIKRGEKSLKLKIIIK